MGSRRIALGLIAAGVVAFVATRLLHPVQGLGNPDIGGILYSADALGAGLLPYRDTVDLKQPGTFFIAALVFKVSRSLGALQLAFALWLLLGAPALWVAARSLYRDEARPLLAPAIATALYLLTAGAFDMNYSAWMMPPYAWSFAWLCRGLQRSSSGAHVLAGLFFSIAYLCKAQAVVLLPLFVVTFLWARRRGVSEVSWRAWPAWALGAALGVLPIGLYYAARGALPNLLHGLAPIEEAAGYGVKRVELATELELVWKVPRQQVRAFFLPLALGLGAVLVRLRPFASSGASAKSARWAPALLFYGASVLGCALGGRRFYVHYLGQCLPAVALLAAHPAVIDWLAAPRAALRSRFALVVSRAHAILVACLLIAAVVRIPLRRNVLADNLGSPAVASAGAYVRERSRPDETLLVWGWEGWGAYFFSERRAPTPVFKVLGQVTTFNDNTAFSKGTSIRFRPGPLADRLLADVRERPPAFIIRATPFFPATTGDPIDEWPEMKRILTKEYRVVRRYRSLTIYERAKRSTK